MTQEFLLYVVVGFAAQIIDGAIGMAYGLTATSILMTSGVPPAVASASVHAAEMFTTGASGMAHWRLGNVDRRLVARLAVPGMIGGAAGAFLLAGTASENIRPFVSAYLLIMGLVIVWRAAWHVRPDHRVPKRPEALGVVGGFLDAVGGGGWGAIVTTTLIGHGATPRLAIGTANVSEFFVTVVVTGTFVFTIGLALWPVILGLVIGGIAAAPLAAYAARYLPDRTVMMIVGLLVVTLSLLALARYFGW